MEQGMTFTQPSQREMEIKGQLMKLINKLSLENESNTPDHVLAEYLYSCLQVFNDATKRRAFWRGEMKGGKPAQYVSEGNCKNG